MGEDLNATEADSFLLASFVRTISRGIPGFTRAAFRYSVPRSIPRMVLPAAEVRAGRVVRRMKRRVRGRRMGCGRRRPGGAIVCEDVRYV